MLLRPPPCAARTGSLYKVFSRTAAGRYLLVVLAYLGGGVWKAGTAREMTQQERRLYRRETGGPR